MGFTLLLLVKLSLLILFGISSLLLLDGSLSKVVALPTIAIAIAIVGRAIIMWKAIQKTSHEPIYKTHTKIEAKRLRATTFAIAMLEER